MSVESPSRTLADAPRADEGYYGPESLSWRIFSDPSSMLGAKNALFLQMLEPAMMTHFERVSLTSDGPEEMALRFDRTSAYLRDAIFADRAHADAAAAHVDRLHERASWTNPETGEVVSAKQPEWQRWTWWTYIWSALRGYQEFGPGLSTDEADRAVRESRLGAEKLFVPGPYFETFADLDQYIRDELNTKSLTLFAALAGHTLRHPDVSGPIAKWATRRVINGILSLLPESALYFYAVEDRSARELARGARFTRFVARLARKNQTAEQLMAQAVGESIAQPYQRVRPARS
ncbi:oxygenase MpaB family protein [Leucobacter sp. PH1c]|uniref:oxygenase MpaB family protein n=1 Tax=Leucobacter sp. PH1c TaxID=1397278 RepID=UPI00046951A8|nr:oxygenase MpaB family protein [Leucobacter sp. PH1c]